MPKQETESHSRGSAAGYWEIEDKHNTGFQQSLRRVHRESWSGFGSVLEKDLVCPLQAQRLKAVQKIAQVYYLDFKFMLHAYFSILISIRYFNAILSGE